MKKKKNPQEDLGPQEINFRFESERMIFEVGGKEFYLPGDKARFLFKREVELELKKANNQDEDFSAFETVENLALFSFHSNRHLSLKDIAKELNFDATKYIRWMNLNSKRIKDLMTSFKREIDVRVAELEKEHSLPEPKKEEKFWWPDSHGKTGKEVAVMLLDNSGPREIAEKLKVPYGQFIKWFLNKDTQRNIIRIRDEEAGKRRKKNEEIKEEL